MGKMNFAVNLLTRKQSKTPRESVEQVTDDQDCNGARVSSSRPGSQTKAPPTRNNGSAAVNKCLRNVQSGKCVPHAEGSRLSHDSILESAWYGTSDPSLSGRASLDGGQGSTNTFVSGLDCDASSLPCCSVRGSLDGSHTGGTGTPRKDAAPMGSSVHAFLSRSSAQASPSPKKPTERGGSRLSAPASPLTKQATARTAPQAQTNGSSTSPPRWAPAAAAAATQPASGDAGEKAAPGSLRSSLLHQVTPHRSNSGSDVRAGSRGSLDSKPPATAPRDCAMHGGGSSGGAGKQPNTISAASTVEFWPGASSCPAGGLLTEASTSGSAGTAASFLAAAAASPQRRRDPGLTAVPEGRTDQVSLEQSPRPAFGNLPYSQQDHHHQQQQRGQRGLGAAEELALGSGSTSRHLSIGSAGSAGERGALGSVAHAVQPLRGQPTFEGQQQQQQQPAPSRPPTVQLPTRSPPKGLDGQLPLEVLGTYGCHIMPAGGQQAGAGAMKEPCRKGRSSIDLLLEPLPPSTITRRPSTDQPELWPSRLSMDSLDSGRSGRTGRRSLNLLSASTMVAPGARGARHSLAAPFRTPQYHSRFEGAVPGAGSFVDLAAAEAALGIAHAASTNMLAGPSGGEMLACDSPNTPMDVGGAGSPFAQGTTASAFASSVVDTSSCCQEGPSDWAAPPQDLWLDPDLHDTFGAHAIMSTAHSGSLGLERPSPSSSAPRTSTGSPHTHLPSDPAFRAAPVGEGRSTAAGRLAPVGAPSAPPAAGLILRPPPPPAAALDPFPLKPTSWMDPSTVFGQHSITVQDPQNSVPSLEFLRARRVARERLEKSGSKGGGYIAEAKRVLSQAMSSADPLETLMVQSSQSGAIGPLLRHLSVVKHDDDALRAGLHTLSLIISNSPNKGIIISFKGQQMLFEILCASQDLQVQQDIVQLLWDLESESEGSTCKACVPEPKCLSTFLGLLERTQSASIASHVIQFMFGFREMEVPGKVLADAAHRLVGVVRAYRYHLQDAAQYTLGLLFKEVLVSPRLEEGELTGVVRDLLSMLEASRHVAQCEATLTILSCIAAAARCRAALCAAHARSKLLQLGQHVTDPRLRARALSLVKVLNKAQLGAAAH